jgi:hypothetical protein
VYLVHVSLLFIGQQGLNISSGTSPCFPVAGGLCKLYANGRKMTNTAPTTLYAAIQAASQSTFISAQFYPLGISVNDKNKQLTLLSQRNPALSGINM